MDEAGKVVTIAATTAWLLITILIVHAPSILFWIWYTIFNDTLEWTVLIIPLFMPYLDGSTLEYLSPSLEKVEWQEWSWWSRARFQLWRDAAMLNPRRNSIIILHIYISIYILLLCTSVLLMPSVWLLMMPPTCV